MSPLPAAPAGAAAGAAVRSATQFVVRAAVLRGASRSSMTRRLGLTGTALVIVPVLLAVAVLPGAAFGPAVSSAAVVESVAVSDAQQVAAAPPALRPLLIVAARRWAIPPALLTAVAQVESGFDPAAVGPPVRGGPAVGLMQFLPASWTRFNIVAGARPTDPGPAALAAGNHLLASGRLPGGGWDPAQGLFGYNRSRAYVAKVLALAVSYGMPRPAPVPPLPALTVGPVTAAASAVVVPVPARRYVFPIAGQSTYGEAHHDYPATDIFTTIGTPVVACVRAEVLATRPVETGKGGITVTLRGEDGFRYYYAHLASLRPDLRVGQSVEAGEVLGRSGNTGNARSTPPHLHLGISRTGSVAGEISPYPYLQRWQSIGPSA